MDDTHVWVRAARAGDGEAFARLFERIAPALYTWADLRLRPDLRRHLEPGDVVGEVWLRAWRGIADFDPGEVPFRPWLFRVAKNVLYEAGRRAGRAREAGGLGPTTRLFALENLPDDATAISRRLMRDEELVLFGERIRALPDEERRLVLHCGLEGMSRREAAARLGLSVEALTKRWQRLRERLRAAGLPRELILEGGGGSSG